MDFTTALSIIKKDLEEARALLEQISATSETIAVDVGFARSRVQSAAGLLDILQQLKEKEVVIEKKSMETKPSPLPPQGEKEEPESSPVSAKSEPQQVKLPDGSKTILADKFSDQNRLGEKITSVKQDEVIVSVRSAVPIDDISSAIGINDKFYFIRELFSGDSLAYQDTIKRLNASASLGEAMKILDESTVMGSDPAAQSSFVDVVRRKFNLNV